MENYLCKVIFFPIFFIALNIVISYVLLCYGKRKQNMFYNQCIILCIDFRTDRKNPRISLIPYFFTSLFELVRNFSDFFYNLIRYKSWYSYKGNPIFIICKKKCNFYSIVDILILFYLIVGILIWEYDSSPCLTFFFIWRILNITSVKISELNSIRQKRTGPNYEFSTFTRLFYLTLINVVEFMFGFSYLYHVNVVPGIDMKNSESLIRVLNIISLIGDKIRLENLCFIQKFFIFWNIFLIFIVISVFISSLGNLDYGKSRKN